MPVINELITHVLQDIGDCRVFLLKPGGSNVPCRVDGFDLETGLTTPNLMESRVNRAMVKSSSKVVAVCDSTKFGHRSLCKIVDASAIHHVITDRNLSDSTADGLRNLGIELTLV